MAFIRRLWETKAPQPYLVVVAGRVAIGSTGAVGTQTGKGFAVTRTGAGLYTITFDSTGPLAAICFCNASVVFATANNTQDAKILTLDATNKKVTLQCADGGTVDVAADPPSGAFLQFHAVIQNSQSTG